MAIIKKYENPSVTELDLMAKVYYLVSDKSLSQYKVADELGMSQSNIQYLLRKYIRPLLKNPESNLYTQFYERYSLLIDKEESNCFQPVNSEYAEVEIVDNHEGNFEVGDESLETNPQLGNDVSMIAVEDIQMTNSLPANDIQSFEFFKKRKQAIDTVKMMEDYLSSNIDFLLDDLHKMVARINDNLAEEIDNLTLKEYKNKSYSESFQNKIMAINKKANEMKEYFHSIDVTHLQTETSSLRYAEIVAIFELYDSAIAML